ncbi:MAG: SMC-Scp complex subunit ScpB [Candidatus Pacebacteria bacterium]|nr:SMC-Scp complex subunit ScpB [Candidatus Paceibacterota bacterium]
MNDLLVKIEALLFALGRPLSRAELAKQLGASVEDISAALAQAQPGRGVVLVDDSKHVELRTAPEAAEMIERIRKDEYAREVGKAGQEVLAAVIYRGPLTRSEIDFIRGVNSSQTLRTLTMRGLVRKIQNPKDSRSFLYESTTELLATLGVQRAQDLPEYAMVREKLTKLEEAYRQKESAEQSG